MKPILDVLAFLRLLKRDEGVLIRLDSEMKPVVHRYSPPILKVKDGGSLLDGVPSRLAHQCLEYT